MLINIILFINYKKILVLMNKKERQRGGLRIIFNINKLS